MHHSSRTTNRPKIEWKDSYSVGIEELDSQHRGLLDLINEVRNLSGAMSKTEPFVVLNAMIKYAQNHFKAEERYLENNDFPSLIHQKRAHENFVEEAFSMAQELDEEGLLTLGGITIYLEEWFKDHVLGSDQEYKAYLEKKIMRLDDPSTASSIQQE